MTRCMCTGSQGNDEHAVAHAHDVDIGAAAQDAQSGTSTRTVPIETHRPVQSSPPSSRGSVRLRHSERCVGVRQVCRLHRSIGAGAKRQQPTQTRLSPTCEAVDQRAPLSNRAAQPAPPVSRPSTPSFAAADRTRACADIDAIRRVLPIGTVIVRSSQHRVVDPGRISDPLLEGLRREKNERTKTCSAILCPPRHRAQCQVGSVPRAIRADSDDDMPKVDTRDSAR